MHSNRCPNHSFWVSQPPQKCQCPCHDWKSDLPNPNLDLPETYLFSKKVGLCNCASVSDVFVGQSYHRFCLSSHWVDVLPRWTVLTIPQDRQMKHVLVVETSPERCAKKSYGGQQEFWAMQIIEQKGFSVADSWAKMNFQMACPVSSSVGGFFARWKMFLWCWMSSTSGQDKDFQDSKDPNSKIFRCSLASRP